MTEPSRPDEGLLLALRLDQIVDGRVPDASGHGRAGLVEGEPAVVPDAELTRCIEFDGVDDAIVVPFDQAFHTTEELTIAMWVKPHADGHFWLPLLQYPFDVASHRRPFFHYGIFLAWRTLNMRIAGTHVVPLPLTSAIEADRWTHLAVTWHGPSESATYYLDGQPAGTRSTGATRMDFASDHPLLIGRNASGPRRFKGRLAGIRLYDRALSAEEIGRFGDLDRYGAGRFVDLYPFSFSAYDDDGAPIVAITEDDTAGGNLHLMIRNRSPHRVELTEPSAIGPSHTGGTDPDARAHFVVRFRPGTLAPHTAGTITLLDRHWDLTVDDATSSLHITHRDGMVIEPGHHVALTLGHVRADGARGARATRVELCYRNARAPVGDTQVEGVRQQHLQVHDRRGRRTSPLRLGLVGSPTLVRDGTTLNTFTAYIGNTSTGRAIALRSGDSPTRFVVSFDKGNAPWSLAEGGFGPETLQARPAGDYDTAWRGGLAERPEWVITPRRDLQLQPGEQIELTVSGLTSQAPAGGARMRVAYDNVPDFWDGELVCEIEKGSIRVDEDRVAIGTEEMATDLDVAGTITAAGGITVPGGVTVGHVKVGAGSGEITVGDTTISAGALTSNDIRDGYGSLVPPGVIVMWTGSTVPAGWVLCNGEHGTPDLRKRFVVGVAAPDDFGPDDAIPKVEPGDEPTPNYAKTGNQGGSNRVTLNKKQMPRHGHAVTEKSAGKHGHEVTYTAPQKPAARGPYAADPFSTKSEPRMIGVNNDTKASVNQNGNHTHSVGVGETGNSKPHENRPPFYVLAFIMKRFPEEEAT